MSMTDPLGDMLARIRNGHMRRKAQVECPASKLKENVLAVLKREGYIRDFRRGAEEAKSADEGEHRCDDLAAGLAQKVRRLVPAAVAPAGVSMPIRMRR